MAFNPDLYRNIYCYIANCDDLSRVPPPHISTPLSPARAPLFPTKSPSSPSKSPTLSFTPREVVGSHWLLPRMCCHRIGSFVSRRLLQLKDHACLQLGRDPWSSTKDHNQSLLVEFSYNIAKVSYWGCFRLRSVKSPVLTCIMYVTTFYTNIY